jgi:hypothetical protein
MIRGIYCIRFLRTAFFIGSLTPLLVGAKPKPDTKRSAPAEKPAEKLPELESTLEGKTLHGLLKASNFQLTPQVISAYYRFAKANALRELTAAGKILPQDFLQWLDSDPVVQATVYGARQNPAPVLLLLRSLELDLGTETVRHKYPQLALAMAVVEANGNAEADLRPRLPINLKIGGDPRHWVNTKAKDRPLDLNDHIINFLEDHPPIEGEQFGVHELPPALVYDERGEAMLDTAKRPKGKAPEKIRRPLYAADVLESKSLQEEFNAYMEAHGQSVRIDCGDHSISPNQHEAIKGPNAKGILEAYKLFRAAYEAKGRLPADRDPFPSPAERCAFLIRNNEFHFADDVAKTRNWPRYPLNAPWPTLTFLAAAKEPLREREEIWTRFVHTGEMIGYGEYIGGIAQQFDFQSARRLCPYPFTYRTFQMMVKDGGVCGTMANLAVRTYTALGVPACTAGQPGHCALIRFNYDTNKNIFSCVGQQYVSGGDEATHPHTPWVFGDVDALRDMVWHQSVAWAVNAGLQSYLDSMVALQIYKALPQSERQSHGLELLASGLALNPFNFALVEAAGIGGNPSAPDRLRGAV